MIHVRALTDAGVLILLPLSNCKRQFLGYTATTYLHRVLDSCAKHIVRFMSLAWGTARRSVHYCDSVGCLRPQGDQRKCVVVCHRPSPFSLYVRCKKSHRASTPRRAAAAYGVVCFAFNGPSDALRTSPDVYLEVLCRVVMGHCAPSLCTCFHRGTPRGSKYRFSGVLNVNHLLFSLRRCTYREHDWVSFTARSEEDPLALLGRK